MVDKIKEFRAIVKDASKPVEERRFALRFLIHCIEDLHMPMHVGENHDREGNDTQVRFFDRSTNMHSLWNSGMIERVSRSEAVWLNDVASQESSGVLQYAGNGGVEDSATESFLAARKLT